MLSPWFHGVMLMGFAEPVIRKGGIEKDVVKACSGGWVPVLIGFCENLHRLSCKPWNVDRRREPFSRNKN
jgi:hypothetical protein